MVIGMVGGSTASANEPCPRPLTAANLGDYYPTYDVGERYLVVANVHDMPAHQFSHACFPRAQGGDVAAIANRIGPPKVILDGPPPPPVDFWVPLVRRARQYTRLLVAIVSLAARD